MTSAPVLGEMGTGMSEVDLPENYPTPRPEHLHAAPLHAAVVALDETISPEGRGAAGFTVGS